MKRDIISQSFNMIIIPMRFFGLYPPNRPSIFFTVLSYTLYIFLLLLSVTLVAVKIATVQNVNLAELIDMWIFVVSIGSGCLKVLPFVTNGKRVKECINYFGHKRFLPKDEFEEEIIEKCIKLCRKNCKVYVYGLVAAGVLWLGPAFMSNGEEFPLKVWLPYDGKSSPQIYYSTFAFFFIASIYDVVANSLADPLIGSLMYHATAQLKILKHNLENINEMVEKQSGKKFVIGLEDAYKILKQCVELHNDILHFVAEFENSFSWSILCQVAGTVLTLFCCFVGFTASSFGDVDTFKYLTFYIVVVAQEFIYCYFGTLLTEESDLTDAICNGSWYKYHPKVRKILITMMERSKAPIIVTAGKVVNMNLQTYTSILKTSYSLFTVSQNFH